MKIQLVKNEAMLAGCLEVRRKVFIDEKKVPESIEVDGNDSLEAECEHFLVTDHGKPIGAFRCVMEKEDTVKLERFCIVEAYRGRNVGTEMSRFVENYYREKGVSYMVANAKFETYKFYEKNGFQAISEVFIEADTPHIKIRKKLI